MSDSAVTVLNRWGRREGGPPTNAVFRAICRSWFRVEWEGGENLPRHGGALLVANHAGMMPVDGGIIQVGVHDVTGRLVYSLAHDGFWRLPFLGRLLESTGAVVGHPENAQRLLAEDGAFVLVFPEGSKGPVKPPSERYRLQRFGRGGFVETALRAGVPIVPITLMGTEDATPMVATFRLLGQDVPLTRNMLLFGPLLGAFAQFPAKVRARVLPPIHFDQPAGLERYPRSVLMSEAERIRAQMQASLDDLYGRRESVWWG
jgi:1-acyl-sn-glycerol-3-phosphate acyltransferase